ncbi:hypothetical protein RvY_18495 [Ramazzottius varieornatus]|uniref:Uncharacterized protein n=1 Tax=Ramazzottius varieornatus TaxID=947166 RepID=A0A1D1W608_RAMVA|nr:hypothetical protein RvY_18495 [Ramazzottius varieornatus]
MYSIACHIHLTAPACWISALTRKKVSIRRLLWLKWRVKVVSSCTIKWAIKNRCMLGISRSSLPLRICEEQLEQLGYLLRRRSPCGPCLPVTRPRHLEKQHTPTSSASEKKLPVSCIERISKMQNRRDGII